MASLTREDLLKLARLARLSLSEAEVAQFTSEISSILDYVHLLDGIDLSAYEPTAQVTGLQNVMRADKIIDYGATPESLLKNAPATQDGHIKVRRMIG